MRDDDERPSADEAPEGFHLDRRKLIIGGAVGGAAAWAAPSVFSVAAAATPSDNGFPGQILPPSLGSGQPYGISPIGFGVPDMAGATQIALSGSTLPNGGFDDATGSFLMPFAFTFFGIPYLAAQSVWVTSNGRGGFGAPDASWTNTPLVAGSPPFFAPYWDDLTVPADGGIFVKVLGTAPNRYVAIEWRGLRAFPDDTAGGTYHFFALLYETFQLDFIYVDVVEGVPNDNGNSASIGVAGATNATEWTFNGGPANGGSGIGPSPNPVTSGSALRVVG